MEMKIEIVAAQEHALLDTPVFECLSKANASARETSMPRRAPSKLNFISITSGLDILAWTFVDQFMER
jgi:hypothetical protein